MILVDSSVWIDFFRGVDVWQTRRLTELLDTTELAIGDLIYTEVLQGCRSDRDFQQVRRLLGELHLITLGGPDIAVTAAQSYRRLRAAGITPRGTVDVVLATRCIVDGHRLLHSDRDFAAFSTHLGLDVLSADH